MMPVASQLFDRLLRWTQNFPGREAIRAASAGATSTVVLTYPQLMHRARAVAARLRAELADDNSPVIVLGHKEPEMVAGFLGAVGSGHPYIPVDDSLPSQRVEKISQLAHASVTLTPAMIASLPSDVGDGKLVAPTASQPFYIIFTSGSTGEPKGVVITTACLNAFLGWMLAEHEFIEGAETFLNQAPYSFDLSVMDLYLSLATGGTLYSISRREIADFRKLYRSLTEAELTTWVSTPSFAQLCLAERTFNEQRLPRLKRFLFCGETLFPNTVTQLLRRFPGAAVWNTYGPTEATVATTSVQIDATLINHGGPLPIGRPRPGTEVYPADDEGNPVPAGERGEIRIAGPNVSPGYLGAPDLTARAFFDAPNGRGYRTGDWGRCRDELLYFEGRQDGQIKLHGYRIELADIEENLRTLPAVRDCAVLPILQLDAVQYLVAFVVPSEESSATSADDGTYIQVIRSTLSERLPAYMIPRMIYTIPALPITTNGKTDRRKLVELAMNGNRASHQ